MSSSSPRFSGSSPPTPTSPTSVRSAGYPFPSTNPSSRYAPNRRGSNASISSIASTSVGGSLDTPHARRGSTVRDTSQNAIANLLQPPIIRTGLVPHNAVPAGWKAPTAKDIPPVTLTNIPRVENSNFREYLGKIGPLLEAFQRGRSESEREGAGWLKKDRELERTDRFAEALGRRMSSAPMSPGLQRQGSMGGLLSPTPETPGALPQRRWGSAQFRRNRNEPTPLSTIPGVYFDEDFHLENPRTFDVVSERAEIMRPAPGAETANGAPRKPITTNAILQEKLSWYMDTVEIHLISSISSASSSFFAALGSLQSLQTEAEESVAKIQGLRADLRKLDQEVALGGLEVAAKKRRRANVRKLERATKQVGRVVEEVKRADELVNEGAYEEAAEQMDRVGRLVCGHASPADGGGGDEGLIDLRPLRALQGLDAGLQDLQQRIGAGFASRFTSILVSDLRQHVERVPSAETLKRWSRVRGIPVTYMETTPQLRADLLAALQGLSKAGYTAQATATYRDAVQREMKSLIRRHLPSSTDEDADSMVSTATSNRGGSGKMSQQEKSSILARNLRALDEADAEKLLVGVYTAVGEALRRVGVQTKVLLDVTSQMSGPSLPNSPPRSPGLRPGEREGMGSPGLRPPGSPGLGSIDGQLGNGAANGFGRQQTDAQEEFSQALDMSSLLGQAVDAAQGQITKVLKVRNEQTVRLGTERFLRYFTLNRLFADECEAVSGQGGLALRGVINAQISGFVQVLGTAETERVAGMLDKEVWDARDFTADDEVLLDRVLGSMGRDPEEWRGIARPVWEDIGHAPEAPQTNDMVEAQTNGTATRNGTPAPGTPAPKAVAMAVKPAYIDETRYLLVRSAASLLTTLDTFLALTLHLGPSLTPAVSAQLTDVLRVFNSRSAQLILGAGATRVAGLKNITTKHLALASQALGFVGALVPYVRECARRHLPAGGGGAGTLAEWDKLKRGLQEHQGQIHDKLVEIMTSRSATHVRSMLATDFTTPSGEDKLSPYMETLTKETLTLHRVLSRHLGAFDVGLIMRRIFEAYREQWCQAFREVEVKGSEAGKRMLKDAEGFEGRLGKVEGFGETGGQVVGIVKVRIGD